MLPEKTVTPQTVTPPDVYMTSYYRLCGVTRKDSNTRQISINPDFKDGDCHHDDFKIRGHCGNITNYVFIKILIKICQHNTTDTNKVRHMKWGILNITKYVFFKTI